MCNALKSASLLLRSEHSLTTSPLSLLFQVGRDERLESILVVIQFSRGERGCKFSTK